MVKFAHLGDCHLGSWKQPELQELNFLSFQYAIDKCIEQKLDFILIAGDLFDSAYPPVEILKRTFAEFRKLDDAGIKCYMIAGSHDYSVSGKTFLDVLEKAGFCEICRYEEIKDEEGNIIQIDLKPIKHNGTEIYGFPGKKSALEVQDLYKIKLPETNNMRILMIHSSITEAIGDIPMDSISIKELPEAEYYALAHLHIDFNYKIPEKNSHAIYSGPIFPNSFQELEDLGKGSFYIVDMQGFTELKKQEIKFKEVISFKIELTNALIGTEKIIEELKKQDIKDKIVLLRVKGELEQGTNADIDYVKIKQYLEEQQVYSFLKNTHKLNKKQEEKSELKVSEGDMDQIEETLIKEYKLKNPDKFNNLILPLTHALSIEKQDDEKTTIYESRLFSEINKILGIDLK